MASLYELSQTYLEVLDALITNEDGTMDITSLEEINDELGNKIENVALYIKDITAFAESIKAEEQNLAQRRKSLENKAIHLKGYLTSCMEMVGQTKFETAKVKLSFRNSKAVEITNETMLPSRYYAEKRTYVPDKVAIKEAIEEGDDVPGAELVERRNLQIK